MAPTRSGLALAGAVLAALLATGCASQPTASPAPVAGQSEVAAVDAGPVIRDTGGALLKVAHADVVQDVHAALQAGDLDALRALYVGDGWQAQAELLGQPLVRERLVAGLETPPENLGEGYVYRADGFELGFFLAPQDGGPLEWRGIQVAGPDTAS